MKNKKILFLLMTVLIIILIIVFFIIKNFNSEKINENIIDYTPEEEINSKQLRETLINLYFIDTNTGNLKSEGKLVDSVELINNPYKKIIELLISGPQNTNLSTVFPDNTVILNASIDKHCVTLDFSSDLLNFNDDIQKKLIIDSLTLTLSELNEVNTIKILINNESNENFNEIYVCDKKIH